MGSSRELGDNIRATAALFTRIHAMRAVVAVVVARSRGMISTDVNGVGFSRRRGPAPAISVALLVLAGLLLFAACAGGGGSADSSSPTSTPAPAQGGGGGGAPPPPELVAILKSLPIHPGSRAADPGFPDGKGGPGHLYMHYLVEGKEATPDDVMRFYFESMPPLGWEVEISPTVDVAEKIANYHSMEVARSETWRQTFVKGDLRVRLVAAPAQKAKDDETIIGTYLILTIIPKSLPPFPIPDLTGTTPPPLPTVPLPTVVEPIPPIGTGPVVTPTLTPAPPGHVEPTVTPILTPTATPVLAQ